MYDVETARSVVAALLGVLALVAGIEFGAAFLMRGADEAVSRD